MCPFSNKPPERRVTPRYNVKMQVRVIWPDAKEQKLPMRDFSNTGLFVELPPPLPAMNTILQLQLQNPMSDSDMPLIRAKVIRHTEEGFGLHILES